MANSIYEGPRGMRPEEYDEVMDLLEKACSSTRQYFLNHSHIERRENFIFENCFIIKEDKKIVSFVRLFPMKAVIDNAEIEIGGIGEVATHPDYQDRGHMSKLMNYSIEKMKEKEIPLSILWGYTQRYRHYGYERAGKKITFQIIPHSVKEVNIGKEFILRGYDRKKDLDKIIEIHKKEPLRIKRSRQDYENLFERPQLQIWMGNEGNSSAYVVLTDKNVTELGGNPSIIAKLFSYLLTHYPIGKLNVYLPYQDSEMIRTLYKISQEWEIMPLGMIKIVDLKETILSFKKQIEDRANLFGIEKGSSITLEMRDSNQRVSLVMDDKIEIKDEESSNVLSLSNIEMARLLFGPSVEEFGENKKQKRLLFSLFPLNFYLWGLDHV